VTEQQGYLKITSDQPVKAFATQIDNISLDPSIENSVATGGTHLLLQSSANTAFQSSLAIINPNGAATTVTLTARDGSVSNNGAITGTKTVAIPANGYVFTENVLAFMGASTLFGPVELQSTAGLPVIAVSRVYNPAGNSSGFFMIRSLP
jgi:hypothetical protein